MTAGYIVPYAQIPHRRFVSPVKKINISGKCNTYVYLMSCNGRVKIGVSHSPARRLVSIQVANSYKVTLVAVSEATLETKAYEYERKLHLFFRKYKVRDEWFEDSICLEAKFYVDCIKKDKILRQKYCG